MKSNTPNFKPLTPDQLQQLFNHANDLRDQVIIGLEAQAGLRHCEAVGFRLRFVDWKTRSIHLLGCYDEGQLTKAGVPRVIPICPALYKLLRRLKDSGYPYTDLVMGPWDVGHSLSAAKARVELHPNALRHSCAVYRLQILRNLQRMADEMGVRAPWTKTIIAAAQPRRVSEAWFAVQAPILP